MRERKKEKKLKNALNDKQINKEKEQRPNRMKKR